MNQPQYTLARIPRKVESFIVRLDRETQQRINQAFESITNSPFRHENPTTIKKLRGKHEGNYRYRIGNIRFIYEVDKELRTIRILQIDNRGDIY